MKTQTVEVALHPTQSEQTFGAQTLPLITFDGNKSLDVDDAVCRASGALHELAAKALHEHKSGRSRPFPE